ncbi:MAG: FAD-binding protein [Gemmatimonadota bacterium]|nr:MAG: FAD-binding protein [Gemmatimonadota bacterium]
MGKKLWDIIVVGGGPAGVTAALRAARQKLDVLVVEAAVYPGAENWSGAVYFAEGLADPNVFGEAELLAAPYERRVVKRGFFATNGLTLAGAVYRNPEAFRHCYTVLRPVYDRYLAERARQLGVTLLTETTVDGLIRRAGRVIGVNTDRGPLYSDVVFLAEGDAAHLVSKEGFERDYVRSKQSGQPAFLQGVKEVIQLDPRIIEERFDLRNDEGACYEVLLRNGALDGKTVRLNMAGFIYTNRSSISLGLVLPLDNLAHFGGDYNSLMEWYKGLPPIKRLIEGGESTSYGAKIIRGGGIKELPELVDDGVAVGGAATGIGVDFPYPNFTGPACAMGKLFAEAVIELHAADQPPSRERLEQLYVDRVKSSNYFKDVEHLQDWPAFIEHSEALFGRQIDVLNGSLYTLTRPQLNLPRKWWELTRMLYETLRGNWLATYRDLNRGAKALHLGRFVLKHAPLAMLLSIPNTLLALLPFAWGRADGHLTFSLWVKDEKTGQLPWYKRWLGARLTPALSRAAGVLYSNDGVPIAQKLDRCVGIVMRRLSLWELLGAAVGAIGLPLTRAAQNLSQVIRHRRSKLVPAAKEATFYGGWMTAWRAHTDMTPGRLPIAKTHDAKLGEISYEGEHGSHIKVFFPPEEPGKLEDPSRSALWTVCPAAVYQINVDRTLHASVTVNFENCVKCETCWRIEPQHVDWTRFGKHRLTYEVYTEADGALRRVLSERKLKAVPGIAESYWHVAMADICTGERVEPAAAMMVDAISDARRAIRTVEAKCWELHDNVWNGARVLEAGQVNWYRGAIEYFADLAEEAAAAALAEPIEVWLVDREMNAAHVELLQLKRDLEAATANVRQHASANRFFAAVADARQIRDHHLRGMKTCIERIAGACLIPEEYPDPVTELRSLEVPSAEREAGRQALRERLAAGFDRLAVRRLEHGGTLEQAEIELLRFIARLGLGAIEHEAAARWQFVARQDVLAELARVDSSMATIVAAHLAGVEALERGGAPDHLLRTLRSGDRLTAVAFEVEAEPGVDGWQGELPFVPLAVAESIVARGGGRVALFEFGDTAVTTEQTPAIGLTGAAIGCVTLASARPVWEADWSPSDEAALFGLRARDVASIAYGAGSLLSERTVDHARGRIQFPDMFQDVDGRDAIGKFGAVRAHIAHIEAGRLALETLLLDTPWADLDPVLEMLLGKVAVTTIFGPDMPSITYRAGQVIGGTAFSEDDVFSKIYRDSSVLPHYIRENPLLQIEIGECLSAGAGPLLGTIASDIPAALDVMERKPILDFEARRIRAAETELSRALRQALEQADVPSARQAVHDIVGEVATSLYIWARLLVRAHRRLEGALPAQRHVEAAQLWADLVEERLVDLDDELAAVAGRVELGGLAFQLDGYPDTPVATDDLDFDYQRDIVGGQRGYRSGAFLLEPLNLEERRYLPELLWADTSLRSQYEEYLQLFRRRYVEAAWQPSFERYVERLHYIPREEIDWSLEQGHFRVPIPQEYGGQGRWKADYYNLCMVAKRLADISNTLTIQASYSIGTTPMLLGLDEVKVAERDLQAAVDQPAAVQEIADGIRRILAMMKRPDFEQLKQAYIALDKEVRGKLSRSRILKKVVFSKFLSSWQKGGMAGLKGDLHGFAKGLEKALAALEGWQERASAELAEMPRRRLAHEFYLRLISARAISAFALTEPSAGSDTARIRTDAHLDSRRVHTDADGVKYFYLDEEAEEGRRNIAELQRFEFDRSKILYRYSDAAEPAEVQSLEFSYDEGEEKYRYFTIGDRRIDIHDMALIRERDGAEYYEFYVLNGAKMWITNAHIAAVEAIYARTPVGVTGFMVDALTEGFLVGKDEEKTGQRGSCTNEITLTNVRIPRECVIGIEGRGQENALETLNVGRTGLCISSAASIQQAIGDVTAYLADLPRKSQGWARYRLGLALEEMFVIESLAYDLIGLYDDKTSDMPRIESSVGKLFGTDGLHRNLHYLEPLYGIQGQLQRYRIEKDRRDARVMTIYEGTNEIQQFLLLKDLVDMIGPAIEKLEGLAPVVSDSPYKSEIEIFNEMLSALHERVKLTRGRYKSAAWQRALLQPIFFRLSRMVAVIKAVDTVIRRADWISGNLTAEGDAVRRAWCDGAARGFVSHARREFSRLVRSFDRDVETLTTCGRTAELRLAETVFDESDAAPSAPTTTDAVPRDAIDQDLKIVLVPELTPALAPRPRLEAGRLVEHVFKFSAGDRRALKLALELKRAAPERVRVTLVCAAPLVAEDSLRFALAAGADEAILLDTGGESYSEQAAAAAIVDLLRARGIELHLLLASASEDGPSEGRLGLRLADLLALQRAPGVTDLWVGGGALTCASDRFPDIIRLDLPCVGAVSGTGAHSNWDFDTLGFNRALEQPVHVASFPAQAERSDELLAGAAATAGIERAEDSGSVDRDRAAAVLIEVGDLGDGTRATAGTPYRDGIREAAAESLDWSGVLFIAELEDEELARSARAPLAAAESIAAHNDAPLSVLVLSQPLSDAQRRAAAGQLLALAPLTRLVFAEHAALGSSAQPAYAEALIQLLGPDTHTRPDYLLTSAWLADALPALGDALRAAGLSAEEVPGVNRVDYGDGDGIAFVRPVHERRLRATRHRPARGNGMRILWCEPEVSAAESGRLAAAQAEVLTIQLRLDYDPERDRIARALAEAKEALGVVSLQNAEFVIDVGAGLGSVDNLETLVEPLRQTLIRLGAPHVLIGATRKVTMDLSWLPDEHQIGQTGVRVNPRVMIALGVSGAPQHLDWVGDRAVIFAFNMDPQAPLMTLNQRRERPKVYPVVGDLFKTLPKFIAALNARVARTP